MNFCSRCVSNVSVLIETKLLDGHLTVNNVWGRFKPIYDDDIRCWRRGMETELPVIWDAITLMWFTDNVALWTPFTLFELGALQRMIQEGSVKWCLPPGSLHTVWQNFPESWWRHQMKIFSRYRPFVGESTGHRWYSPYKGLWRGALMFSLICAWTNGGENNRDVEIQT